MLEHKRPSGISSWSVTFADMVTAGITERTANGWNRKTITSSDLTALAPDDPTVQAAALAAAMAGGAPTDDVVALAARASDPALRRAASLWAAARAATDPAVTGGQYYGPDGFREVRGYPTLVQSNAKSRDRELQTRLWTVSEELTGVTYPV